MTSKEVAKAKTTTLTTTHDYGEYSGAGGDQIDSGDINIPRLKLCQAMTPEVKDEKLAEEGDILHTITREVICKKGEIVDFYVVNFFKEYVLWRDRKMGGGVMARARRVMRDGMAAYQWDKPNQIFEDKIGGQLPVKYATKNFVDEDGLAEWGSQIPGDPDSGKAATETHNYIIVIPSRDYEVVAMSLSRTQSKKARDLNAMLKVQAQRGIPTFALRVSMATMADHSDANTFANYVFRPSGLLAPSDPGFGIVSATFKSLLGRSIILDLDDEEGVQKNSSGKSGKF